MRETSVAASTWPAIGQEEKCHCHTAQLIALPETFFTSIISRIGLDSFKKSFACLGKYGRITHDIQKFLNAVWRTQCYWHLQCLANISRVFHETFWNFIGTLTRQNCYNYIDTIWNWLEKIYRSCEIYICHEHK